MPYRPTVRRAPGPPTGAAPGIRPRRSYAARVATARAAAPRPRRRGRDALVAAGLVLLIASVTLASAAIIAAGGVAGITIATLDRGLPDVRTFGELELAQPSRILDRTGSVELARFWEERRTVLEFEDIPRHVLDVTTAIEDDTYWDNPGFDLVATLAAAVTEATGGGGRGASTITQQLVRRNLLPDEVIADDDTRDGLYVRKAKELLQAYKLTQAYPGEAGKQAIITAYLNDIPYGANAYGIAAAADVYFGKELKDLTISEAAILAGIPQAPTTYDLFKHTRIERVGPKRKGRKRATRLVVREDSPPMQRRDYVLRRLRDGKGRWTSLTEERYREALAEAVVLKEPRVHRFKAPHFVWALRDELDAILADRAPLERGGYTVTTTLDHRAQKLAEKYVKAGALVPNVKGSAFGRQVRKHGLRSEASWMQRLRGANIRNGALVAMDYTTGDILAYVGSAGYYRKSDRRFDPRYDHAGQGRRQPGSAWKPIVYATAIDTGALSAGSVLLDITTPFGPGWQPKDADRVDRGPILVREALQHSLNVPAIRALDRAGVRQVRRYATEAGLTFIGGDPRFLDRAGLAGAIGTVEIRLIDLVAAYGAFGNDGRVTRPRYVRRVEDADGNVIYRAGDPVSTRVWKPETAYIIADILKGNTDPRENAIWGERFRIRNIRGGGRRIAALKTGTTNDLRDFSTYGVLPRQKGRKRPSLAVGVWFGNSDHSAPTVPATDPIYSSDNAGEVWQAFVREYTRGWPNPDFRRPDGVVSATIDRFSGGAPGPWTRATTRELFIRGTQPGGKRQIDPPGLIYSRGCDTYLVQPVRAENPGAPTAWRAAVEAWARRGGRGRSRWGTTGRPMTEAGKSSFGGPVVPGTGCAAPRQTTDRDGRDGSGSPGPPAGREATRDRRGPVPTCRPGTTDVPAGCTIPAPE